MHPSPRIDGSRNLMVLDVRTGAERLVKTRDRVEDLGEVFTPAATVQAMLDLLPADMWDPHPARTFLEPACGNGNFLVAILDRKLTAVAEAARGGLLQTGPAGVEAYALEALASVYGVDISSENIYGSPAHTGAHERMLAVLAEWCARHAGGWDPAGDLARSARWVLDCNVQVGNMLPFDPDGSASGWERLPLVEYVWDHACGRVSVAGTTLGDVQQAAREQTDGVLALFGPPAPRPLWSGPVLGLWQAGRPRGWARKVAR